MDKRAKIQIALPFLLIIVSLFTVKLLVFRPALTPEETQMLGFVPEKIVIQERPPFMAIRNLRSPIEIVKAPPVTPVSYPSIPLSAIAPQAPAAAEIPTELRVSMIVISETRRMAIINGFVVKEGDGIGSTRITKIERKRVLLKEFRPSINDKREETRWVYLEEKK